LGAARAASGESGTRAGDTEDLQEIAPIQTVAHRLTSSIMTDETVRTHLALAMTIDAPAHLQRIRLGDAIPAPARSAVPDFDFLHCLDRPVALLTFQPGIDMPHVREVRVVRQIVDA